MRRSYAVLWTDGGAVVAGRLQLAGGALELRGRAGARTVGFCELGESRIERGVADRLRGLPVLELELRHGGVLRIATLEGAGVLHEIADRVAAIAAVTV